MWLKLDLTDIRSVRAAVDRLRSEETKLDILSKAIYVQYEYAILWLTCHESKQCGWNSIWPVSDHGSGLGDEHGGQVCNRRPFS